MSKCKNNYLVLHEEFNAYKDMLEENHDLIIKQEECIVCYYYDTISHELYHENKFLRLVKSTDKFILEMVINNEIVKTDVKNIDIKGIKYVNNRIHILQGLILTSRITYKILPNTKIHLDRNYYLGTYDYEISIENNENEEVILREFNDVVLAESKDIRFYKRKLANMNMITKKSDGISYFHRFKFDGIIEYIDKNGIYNSIRLENMCKLFLTNHTSLSTKFKKTMGLTLSEYLVMQRIMQAQYLLIYSSMLNNIISAKVGFSNCSHFHRQFKEFVGITPYKYKQQMLIELEKSGGKFI